MIEYTSIMMDGSADVDLDRAVAARVRSLRTGQGLSLEALAAHSGVSRAMISRIERGEASPTAALLNRLCAALGVTLSALFAAPAPQASPVARRTGQPAWRDPETGYLRRAVSPPGTGSPVEVVEVTFPPGRAVAFAPHAFGADLDQHVWVIEGGALEMRLGDDPDPWRLEVGDCLHMRLDRAIHFHNPGPGPVRYAVILDRRRDA